MIGLLWPVILGAFLVWSLLLIAEAFYGATDEIVSAGDE